MRGINLVALTPSIDERIVIERFALGGAYDALAAEAFPAGKAVNCAAALSTLMAMYGAARPARLFGIVGRDDVPLFERLDAPPVAGHWVPDPAPTRRNITLVDQTGAMLCHVRRPTDPIAPASFEALLSQVERAVQPGELCAVAGRRPNGLTDSHVQALLATLARRGVRIVVDLRPETLGTLDLTGVLLAKPNLEELSELSGKALTARAQIVDSARQLAARGPAHVAVSLGADGALLVTQEDAGYWLAEPLHAPAQVDPVGCGDAMVAGLCLSLARGESPDLALRTGMAAGYGNLFTPGPGRLSVPHVQDALAQVRVSRMADA